MDAEIPISVTFVAPEGSATVGVENIAADNAAAVYGTRGAINVTGYEGRVDVYSIAGQLVNSQNHRQATVKSQCRKAFIL